MIWTIAGAIALFLIIKFIMSLENDKTDLRFEDLSQKFSLIVRELNQEAFNGRGRVYKIDLRTFNLYEEGQNQIINFHYSSGHLTITWKYKYYQKEIVHKKQFDYSRNLSLFEQQNIARVMINEMNGVIASHKNQVYNQGRGFQQQLMNSPSVRRDLENMLKNDLRVRINDFIEANEVDLAREMKVFVVADHFINELEEISDEQLQILGFNKSSYRSFIGDLVRDVISEYEN